jgi:hypothetical protein
MCEVVADLSTQCRIRLRSGETLMNFQCYRPRNFRRDSVKLIAIVNAIIEEYMDLGYTLTVRQLYYQCIARDVLPDSWIDTVYNAKHGLPADTKNTQKNYDKLQELCNDARLAGVMRWDAIIDITREFDRNPRWGSASDMMQSIVPQFHMDPWITQDVRFFCIVEKDALRGVLQRSCNRWDIPLLASRGYPSVSVIREFVLRDFSRYYGDQKLIVLDFSDHDPSGIDMTRDLQDRMEMFCKPEGFDFKLIRVALNMPQIKKYKPPPNPAKLTDSRYEGYRRKFGDKSWELDALNPTLLNSLVDEQVELELDAKAWKKRQKEIEEQREIIADAAEWAKDK